MLCNKTSRKILGIRNKIIAAFSLLIRFTATLTAMLPLIYCSFHQVSIGLANPASVYCTEQGGKLKIVTHPNGGQTGWCIFNDGSQCEEWDFYQGRCYRSSPIPPTIN